MVIVRGLNLVHMWCDERVGEHLHVCNVSVLRMQVLNYMRKK